MIGIPAVLSKAQVTTFHTASAGSPIFASSILRLMQTGESFIQALEAQESPDPDLLQEVQHAAAILTSSWNDYRRQLPP